MSKRKTTTGQFMPGGWRSAGVNLCLLAALSLVGHLSAEDEANEGDASAQESPVVDDTPDRYDFEYFAIILERNIFDPDRSPRSREPEPEPPSEPKPRVDIVSLTGTLRSVKGDYAFFDSDSSEFQKTATVGDQIAGFHVKEIRQSDVALQTETESIRLEVGQQLRREDEGKWQITASAVFNTEGAAFGRSSSRRGGSDWRSEPSGASASTSPADDEASDNSSEPSSGEGPSEALKRLLEQRRKEQSQ